MVALALLRTFVSLEERIKNHTIDKKFIMKFTRFFLILILTFTYCSAQKVSKLTITDNLNANNKFSYGKPKPAAPKDHFYLLSDKGTQVLCYAELNSTDSINLVSQTLKFTAYKTDSGKDEWIDDRVIKVKIGGTYVMTAFNFFDIGNYKIAITQEEGSEILAQSTFLISK